MNGNKLQFLIIIKNWDLNVCKDCHKKTDSYGSKIHLRKRGELLENPKRTISSQAEKSEGSTVRDEIIPISAPHSVSE